MARPSTLKVVRPSALAQKVEGPLRHLESIAESMRERQVWPRCADEISDEVAAVRQAILDETDVEVG